MSTSSFEDDKCSSEALLADEHTYSDRPQSKRRSRQCQIASLLHWTVHAVTTLLIIGLVFHRNYPSSFKDFEVYSETDTCYDFGSVTKSTQLRPEKPLEMTEGKFQASFWQKTPYKGPPTPDVIAHWHHLTHTPALNLTEEEVRKMGISTDSVQYPAEDGGVGEVGDPSRHLSDHCQGYLAYLESAHQLHCLEALWEDHHYRKYPEMFPLLKQKLDELPVIMEHHLEHCVDVLRQQLMCNAEPGVITFRWVEGISGPYPDFNSKHVCHDYESLLGWAERRKIDPELMHTIDWKPPETGVVKLKKAP